MTNENEMLTTKELAAELRVKVQTLRVWRMKDKGPDYVRVSRNLPLYPRKYIDEWKAARTFSSTSAESVAADNVG